MYFDYVSCLQSASNDGYLNYSDLRSNYLSNFVLSELDSHDFCVLVGTNPR